MARRPTKVVTKMAATGRKKMSKNAKGAKSKRPRFRTGGSEDGEGLPGKAEGRRGAAGGIGDGLHSAREEKRRR